MCQHRAHHVPVHLDCEAPDHADKNPDRQRLVLLMGIRTQGAPLPHLDCKAPNHADKNPDRQRLVLLALVLRHSNICGGNSKPGGGCFGGGVVGAHRQRLGFSSCQAWMSLLLSVDGLPQLQQAETTIVF